MPNERVLTPSECTSAVRIQEVIDSLGAAGGRVVLPALDLVLDRGLELRSRVELTGQGGRTVLRKAAGRTYPLSGYHNYGMYDVPLRDPAVGLSPGMTVSVLDDQRGGFYSTFARITWVDGKWVGLDRGLSADYSEKCNPRLTLAFPMIFGHDIRQASVRDLVLDGNRAQNEAAMDGCRGGCVYFAGSHEIDVTGVSQRNFAGEGLSFQMCSQVRIQGCSFIGNTGNGMHPGAGSTGVLFDGNAACGNEKAGFYFCVRANHITLRRCRFEGNQGPGVSIGRRDCHNLIEECRMLANNGPGLLVRATAVPTEVHSCLVRRCEIAGNNPGPGSAQVRIEADAHDLIFEENTLLGLNGCVGVMISDQAHRIWLDRNTVMDCAADTSGPVCVGERPVFSCGLEAATPAAFRHLFPGGADSAAPVV